MISPFDYSLLEVFMKLRSVKAFLGLSLLAGSSLLVGCEPSVPSGTQIEAENTKIATTRIVQSVGYPSTPNALVKKLLRLTYELTDRGVDTHIYFRKLDTSLRYICPGYGYPTAYATQFSRPTEATYASSTYGVEVLPQAEPDGTYKGEGHSGTYYLCKGKKGIYLEYEESNVHASSVLKVTSSRDELIDEKQPLLTYQEIGKMKKLQGAELDAFLKVVADRITAKLQ
jgi:hypothetical protein